MISMPDKNKKFGKLIVLRVATNDVGEIKKSKDGRDMWVCECICGRISDKRSSSVLSGNTKSCGHCRGNLTNRRFGKLLVISIAKDINGHIIKKNNSKAWKCICDCGNVSESVSAGHLKSGNTTSCGKCVYKDISGQKFGKLTALYPLIKNGSKIKDRWRSIFWVCKCECGGTKKVTSGHLNSGDTRSCGCITSIMQSALTNIIQDLFNAHEVLTNVKSINWLRNPQTKRNLEIDIYIRALGLAIEYDGEQHFVPMRYGAKKDMQIKLDKAKEYDNLKNKLIREHIETKSEDIKYFIRFNYKESINNNYVKAKLIDAGVMLPAKVIK